MVRYNPEFRQNEDQIGKILVPASDGAMIPVKELADIRTITGPLLISGTTTLVSVRSNSPCGDGTWERRWQRHKRK